MLTDWVVARAISGIAAHAEQQRDTAVLERTYVDSGVLARILNGNNQIVYGRRGTGKSHLLRVAAAAFERSVTESSLYVDLRQLGSAQFMTDLTQPLTVRCVTVFRDLLAQFQDRLLDLATDPGRPNPGNGLEAVSALADTLASRATRLSERQVTVEQSTSQKHGWSVGGRADSAGIGLAGNLTDEAAGSMRHVEEYKEVLADTIIFAEVANSLAAAVSGVEVDRIVVLLDEWATIPLDVQPYMAEFLKRTLLPLPSFSLKIASLEQRSKFYTEAQPIRIGFEVGSDVTANLDLDDYYSYDRAPSHTSGLFSELLYRHMRSELPSDYLDRNYDITSAAHLRDVLFANAAAFAGLVQASNGVARDFLGIFTAAFFRSVRDRGASIEQRTVEESARRWFETDKAPNLGAELERALRRIVCEALGAEGSRYFLLTRDDSLHPSIQSLFDMRVIHLADRGWKSSRYDERLDLYSVDLGAWRALAGHQLARNDESYLVDDGDDTTRNANVPLVRLQLNDPSC